MRRLAVAVYIALSVPALAGGPARVALRWAVAGEALSCPSEQQVQSAVAERLGYSPFDPMGERRVDASVAPTSNGLVGVVELFGEDGASLGKRELSSAAGDCLELARAMELAIAIAIDPRSLTGRPKQPTVATPAPSAEPSTAASQPPTPLHLDLGATILASVGTSPTATGGAAVGARLVRTRFSLGLDARGDLDSTLSVPSGKVTTSEWVGSLIPCARAWRLDFCAEVTAGALQVTGMLSGPPNRQSSPLLMAGVRVATEFWLSDSLAIQPYVGAQAVLTRTSLLSGNETVWVTAPVAGALGLRLLVRIF